MAQVLQAKNALDGEFGPVAESVAVFVEIATPAVVMLEQQLCGARNVHGVVFTGWRGEEKGVGTSRLTSQSCSFYAGVSAAGGMSPPASDRYVRWRRR